MYYGWCHAGSSAGVVQSYCVGQTTCNVPAVNGVFGDPCVGAFLCQGCLPGGQLAGL